MRKTFYKKIARVLLLAAAIFTGQILFLIEINNAYEANEAELTEVESELTEYKGKRDECSSTVNTTNALINSAGLSSCGEKRAGTYHLTIASLNSIYRNYCYQGAGVAVYGCVNSGRVYVCSPGSSVYDVLSSYSTPYSRHWTYLSYSCSEADSKNTIRHELLHTVYSELSASEQKSVASKLLDYVEQYVDELSVYSTSQVDDELFARVGADGRSVDDIGLIDLYSQVVSDYLPQRVAYYADLVNTTSEQVASYTELLERYETLRGGVTLFVVASFVVVGVEVIAISAKTKESEGAAEKSTNKRQKLAAKNFSAWAKKHGVEDEMEDEYSGDRAEAFQAWAEQNGLSDNEEKNTKK